MSPLDDELRAALHGRATVVPPSPDPLAGIERRATRMRRNRIAAQIAGSALAVAAVATAVPLLQGSFAPRSDVPPVASAAPTLVPSPTASTSPYALSPERPWPFRGTPVEEGTRATVERELVTRTGAAEVAVTPLFAQLYEPSQQLEVVYLAVGDGGARWGVARSTEAGPEILVDEPLPEPALALAAALPGDEVARLLVVASPAAGPVEYGPDDASEFAAMTEIADGVAIGPLEGEPGTDSYRLLDPAGAELLRAAAPDPSPPATDGEAPPEGEAPADPPAAPANVVDWPVRGGLAAPLQERAVSAFARAAGVPRDQVGSRLLFAGQRDERVYVLLQGWDGGDARAFAWSFSTRDGSTASVLHDPTPPEPVAFGAVLDGVLMVVPPPTTGQVLYAPDATSEPRPVEDQGTEAAVLVERAPGAEGDHLLILDGNGDPDRPIFRGTVEELLGASS